MVVLKFSKTEKETVAWSQGTHLCVHRWAPWQREWNYIMKLYDEPCKNCAIFTNIQWLTHLAYSHQLPSNYLFTGTSTAGSFMQCSSARVRAAPDTLKQLAEWVYKPCSSSGLFSLSLLFFWSKEWGSVVAPQVWMSTAVWEWNLEESRNAQQNWNMAALRAPWCSRL